MNYRFTVIDKASRAFRVHYRPDGVIIQVMLSKQNLQIVGCHAEGEVGDVTGGRL